VATYKVWITGYKAMKVEGTTVAATDHHTTISDAAKNIVFVVPNERLAFIVRETAEKESASQ
jgi:hypothetical protein